MAIVVSCDCGKSFSAHEKYAGKKGKCPSCGKVLAVPALPPPPPPPPAEEQFPDESYALTDLEAAVPPPPPPMEYTNPIPAARMPTTVIVEKEEEPALGFRVREYLYFALLVALLPLGFSLLMNSDDIEARVKATAERHQVLAKRLIETEGALTKDDLKLLPDKRLEGALLPLNSDTHWGFAAISGVAFFSLVMFCFPGTCANPKNLVVTAVFTATLGILFLLAIQFIADFTQNYWVRGRGILVLIFYVLKFIGFSYRAALGDTGFLLSFLGFTFGVGLCEEIVKAIPILWWQQKYGLPSWRFAALIGLASGIGFGISEGISYSSDYYNGVSTGSIYLVRFASCVALHAVWSASVSVTIFNLQYKVDTSEPWLVAIRAALIPMVLHGLYDTLLKKDMNVYALATAIASFALLVWQIETARRNFGEEEESQEEEELASTRTRRAGTMARV